MSMSSWELRARELYAESPAVTPFSGQPIPYERAAASAIKSYGRAVTLAIEEMEQGK